MLELPEIVDEEWLKAEGYEKVEFHETGRIYYALKTIIYKQGDNGKFRIHLALNRNI